MTTHRQVRRNDRLLRALRETNALVAAARDATTAARVVAERVVDVVGAEGVIICVPDGEHTMRLVYAAQPVAWEPRPGLQFAISLCDQARQEGQSITWRATNDMLRRRHGGIDSRSSIRSAGAVPLHVGDHVGATVGVGWSHLLEAVVGELDLVELVASPLGSALEMLRLASRLERNTSMTQAMSEFLCRDVHSTLGEQDVAQLALRLAMRTLQPHCVAVWLLESDLTARYAAGIGYPRMAGGEIVPLNHGMVQLASVDVVNLTDVPIEPVVHHTGFARGARCSYLAAPIRRHGISLGAFEVIAGAGRQVGDEEVELLISIASGMAIGVTGAREASELDQEERRLAAVVEQLPSGVLVIDIAGRPTLMNSACRRVFGRLDPSRPVAEQSDELDLKETHGGEPLPISALLNRVLAGDEVRGWEAAYRPAGAEIEHWVNASGVPLRDSAARIAGAVVVVTDVTPERRLAGELAATVRQNLYLHGALAESERRLGGLIQNLLRPQGKRPPATIDRQLGVLTPREREVLGLLGEGRSTADMARELQLSVSTVRLHVKHVLAKLGVTSRTQAALRAHELSRQSV